MSASFRNVLTPAPSLRFAVFSHLSLAGTLPACWAPPLLSLLRGAVLFCSLSAGLPVVSPMTRLSAAGRPRHILVAYVFVFDSGRFFCLAIAHLALCSLVIALRASVTLHLLPT